MQQPYEELEPVDVTLNGSDDDMSELSEEAASDAHAEPTKELKRSDTVFYDAGAAITYFNAAQGIVRCIFLYCLQTLRCCCHWRALVSLIAGMNQ